MHKLSSGHELTDEMMPEVARRFNFNGLTPEEMVAELEFLLTNCKREWIQAKLRRELDEIVGSSVEIRVKNILQTLREVCRAQGVNLGVSCTEEVLVDIDPNKDRHIQVTFSGITDGDVVGPIEIREFTGRGGFNDRYVRPEDINKARG